MKLHAECYGRFVLANYAYGIFVETKNNNSVLQSYSHNFIYYLVNLLLEKMSIYLIDKFHSVFTKVLSI